MSLQIETNLTATIFFPSESHFYGQQENNDEKKIHLIQKANTYICNQV